MRIFYTDGSNSNNGKADSVGGYAYVEVSSATGDCISTFSSSEYSAIGEVTNNRMEIMAVISALRACGRADDVLILSDSAYIVNCINENWMRRWKATGKTSTGKTPSNMDLWLTLERCMRRCGSVEFQHVKGHAQNVHNNMADMLARQAMISRRTLEANTKTPPWQTIERDAEDSKNQPGV